MTNFPIINDSFISSKKEEDLLRNHKLIDIILEHLLWTNIYGNKMPEGSFANPANLYIVGPSYNYTEDENKSLYTNISLAFGHPADIIGKHILEKDFFPESRLGNIIYNINDAPFIAKTSELERNGEIYNLIFNAPFNFRKFFYINNGKYKIIETTLLDPNIKINPIQELDLLKSRAGFERSWLDFTRIYGQEENKSYSNMVKTADWLFMEEDDVQTSIHH